MNNTVYAVIFILIVIAVVVSVIIDRKKYFGQIAEKCDPVLSQLKANGDNHALARVVDHWIYFNSKTDLDTFISEVNKIGFILLSEQTKEADVYNYVVDIGREENVIRKNIIQTVSKLERIAKKHNGFYDGWGCPIMR